MARANAHLAVAVRGSLAGRFRAFVLEHYPFAQRAAATAFDEASGPTEPATADDIERLRSAMPAALRRALASPPADLPEPTPAVSAGHRWTRAVADLLETVDGFFRRAAIQASLTPDERREILRGMVLTRATDNRLKTFFTGGEVRYGEAAFQGKGFRSLGQEAIYAAAAAAAARRRRIAHRRQAGPATSSRR